MQRDWVQELQLSLVENGGVANAVVAKTAPSTATAMTAQPSAMISSVPPCSGLRQS
jgi:hypothetical protein